LEEAYIKRISIVAISVEKELITITLREFSTADNVILIFARSVQYLKDMISLKKN